MKLYCDFWISNKNKEETYDDVSLELILKKFTLLNGKDRTELLLKNKSSITIGGGNNDLFIVYYAEDDNMFLLKNSKKSSDIIKLVVGGQLADFDIKYCHERNTVKKILIDYFNYKNVLSLYKWEQQ